MKLLEICDGVGSFLSEHAGFVTIEKITKEDLLRLAGLALEDEVQFDQYEEGMIGNKAQQIIYKNVFERLSDLAGRRSAFRDESRRLFLTEYEKYRGDAAPSE